MPLWRRLGKVYLHFTPCIRVLNLGDDMFGPETVWTALGYTFIYRICCWKDGFFYRHKVMVSHYIYSCGSTDLFMTLVQCGHN